MSKKKWAILILCMLLLAGYYKFFYKTWNANAVPKSSDCIISVDIKRIRNTLIWNFITTPSQWHTISFSSAGKFSWKDMVKLPDYIFVFHAANQPANAWYSLLEISNDDDFNKGLQLYHFELRATAGGMKEYFSNELGIDLLRNANSVLIGNLAVPDKIYLRQTGEELFLKKQFATRAAVMKNINAAAHVALQFAQNRFLSEAAILTLCFDKNTITIDGSISPWTEYDFSENNFHYSSNSLLVSGFTQPSQACYDLIPGKLRSGISRALNFNMDSLFLQSNRHYEIDMTSIQPRVDSAISYAYDDNFNQVEKVVVNEVLEPSFGFDVTGDSISNIYEYWQNNHNLEPDGSRDLFTAIPFAKSYCRIEDKNRLSVSSANYRAYKKDDAVNCILFLNLMIEKISPATMKYFPNEIIHALANLHSVQLVISKEANRLALHGIIKKKKNDLPLFAL